MNDLKFVDSQTDAEYKHFVNKFLNGLSHEKFS